MPFYVDIIQSEVDGSFYKGFSENPLLRLQQHNNKECTYTSRKTPWKLVYIEEMKSKKDALIRERNLKKATRERIEALIIHPKNIVHKFIHGYNAVPALLQGSSPKKEAIL